MNLDTLKKANKMDTLKKKNKEHDEKCNEDITDDVSRYWVPWPPLSTFPKGMQVCVRSPNNI